MAENIERIEKFENFKAYAKSKNMITGKIA